MKSIVSHIVKGNKYGFLELTGNWNRVANSILQAEVKCVCGRIKFITFSRLKSGKSKSCGCKRSENKKNTDIKNGSVIIGIERRELYQCHYNMLLRCYNIKNDRYKNYGGRGISVCKEWIDSFECFYYWAINNGWNAGLTLDRKKVNEGYSPDNCRWETRIVQARNTTRNLFITSFGETKCLSEWIEKGICKVTKGTISRRLKNGWAAEDALVVESSTLKILK